jgi:hypothetical protein
MGKLALIAIVVLAICLNPQFLTAISDVFIQFAIENKIAIGIICVVLVGLALLRSSVGGGGAGGGHSSGGHSKGSHGAGDSHH